MAWTYDDPSQSAKDAVRFAIGDTDIRRPQLQDAEVLYCLNMAGGHVGAAAVLACEAVVTLLGRLCDQTVGSVSKSYSQLQASYLTTLANLRRKASSSGGVPFVGGISHTANAAPFGNPDYNRPQFTTKMMHPRRGNAALVQGGDLRERGRSYLDGEI